MIKTLRELWHAQPFVAFSVHLADGRRLKVPHPNFFYMSPMGGQIFIADKKDDVHFLNPLVIVSVSKSDKAAKV